MKKLLIGYCLLFFLHQSTAAQTYSIKNLIGSWISADGGGIDVVDSSKIFIIYGKEKKQLFSYQADFSKSPCWFDFTLKDSAQTMNMKSLLFFINDDLLQWEVFDDGQRPIQFTVDKGDMVYLRRKK